MVFNRERYSELLKQYPALPPNLKEEQLLVVKHVVEGSNVLAVLPTGFGKSLTYIVPPLLEKEKMAVVISPLRALMADQITSLRKKGVLAVAITADMSDEDREHVKNGDVQIVMASPEALEGWLPELDSDIYRRKVCLVAIDEVHTLADWGDSFRPAFLALGRLRSIFDHAPLLMLTATLTEAKRYRVYDIMHVDHESIREVFSNPDRPNITLFVKYKSGLSLANEMEWCLNTLRERKKSSPKCVVYVNGSMAVLGRTYSEVRGKLGKKAFATEDRDRKQLMVELYHGSLTDEDRRRVLEEFAKEDSVIRCLFCTSAFGMGIDVADIRYVIVYGAPSTMSELWQQIGRAGRDGNLSEARILFTPQTCQRTEQSVKLLHDASKVPCLREFILKHVFYKAFDIRAARHTSQKCCCFCDKK